MKYFIEGGLWRALLLLPLTAQGQLSVLNGLSHFHPCSDVQRGEIWIQNEGDSALTVLLEKRMPLGSVEELQITSEVYLPSHAKVAIPFRWNVGDSLARHAEIELYALPTIPVSSAKNWTVVTEIHYLLHLYTGCTEEAPEKTLSVGLDSILTCTYTGFKIWKAYAQSMGALGQPLGKRKPLFFYPGKVQHYLPEQECSYVLIEDERGHTIGIPWKQHAH
ncbi:MAG: hypothetical protein RL168_408 [Bacteroidota bacterium]|jgi:hypothetical protein